MPASHKFTDSQLFEALATDRLITEISKDFGCLPTTVYKRARDLGVVFNGKRPGVLRNMTDSQVADYRVFRRHDYSHSDALAAVGYWSRL